MWHGHLDPLLFYCFKNYYVYMYGNAAVWAVTSVDERTYVWEGS